MFGAGFLACFVLCAKTAPQTFAQYYTMVWFQSYEKGLQTRISQKMAALIQEVMDDLEATPAEAAATRVFVCTRTDAISWGGLSPRSHYSFLFAYPPFFHYETHEDVEQSGWQERMRFSFHQSSDKQRETGLTTAKRHGEAAASFAKSLVLSDDARKFAIAREIERGRMNLQRVEGLKAALPIVVIYVLARFINQRLGLFHAPPKYRGLVYAFLAVSVPCLSVVAADEVRSFTAGVADRRAARVYADGGVEYYEKMLQRHAALRELMPHDEGKKAFTLRGDFFPGLVRTKHRSVVKRRDDCASQLTL